MQLFLLNIALQQVFLGQTLDMPSNTGSVSKTIECTKADREVIALFSQRSVDIVFGRAWKARVVRKVLPNYARDEVARRDVFTSKLEDRCLPEAFFLPLFVILPALGGLVLDSSGKVKH